MSPDCFENLRPPGRERDHPHQGSRIHPHTRSLHILRHTYNRLQKEAEGSRNRPYPQDNSGLRLYHPALPRNLHCLFPDPRLFSRDRREDLSWNSTKARLLIRA